MGGARGVAHDCTVNEHSVSQPRSLHSLRKELLQSEVALQTCRAEHVEARTREGQSVAECQRLQVKMEILEVASTKAQTEFAKQVAQHTSDMEESELSVARSREEHSQHERVEHSLRKELQQSEVALQTCRAVHVEARTREGQSVAECQRLHTSNMEESELSVARSREEHSQHERVEHSLRKELLRSEVALQTCRAEHVETPTSRWRTRAAPATLRTS